MCRKGGPRCVSRSQSLMSTENHLVQAIAERDMDKALDAMFAMSRRPGHQPPISAVSQASPSCSTDAEQNSGLELRRYSACHPVLKSSLIQIEQLLSSLTTEYEAKSTIESMKLSEDLALSDPFYEHSMTMASLNSQRKEGRLGYADWASQAAQANLVRRRAELKVKTNWRQTEWLGWNFENSIIKATGYSKVGGKGELFGHTVIDTMIGSEGNTLPMDVKFHSMYRSDGTANTRVILNDRKAVDACIEKYGAFVVLVAKASVDYDHSGEIKALHNELKGRRTKSASRNSRLMKSSARVKEYAIYVITAKNKHMLDDFKQGSQQSGKSRNPKYSLYFGKGGMPPVVKFVTEYGRAKGR